MDLGKSIGYILGWALIPGIIIRVCMGCLNRGKGKVAPGTEAYKKKKSGMITWLALMYFAYKMYNVVAKEEENLYDIMGISFPVGRPSIIKKAFRKLSLSAHPDKGGSEELFNRIRDAYEILGDINLRRIYDRLGPSVFSCSSCNGLSEYWLSQRMLDTCLNYFMATVFLVWSTWSHDRSWIRPYMWCLLGSIVLVELVFVFSDEAPEIEGRPNFEVIEILRQIFFVALSTACIVCNYWPGDPRSDREIVQAIEKGLIQTNATMHQMLIMNQCIFEDPDMKTRLEAACKKRHETMKYIMSHPAAAEEFARRSVEAFTKGKGRPDTSNITSKADEGPSLPVDLLAEQQNSPAAKGLRKRKKGRK